jgi:hypothetical protein
MSRRFCLPAHHSPFVVVAADVRLPAPWRLPQIACTPSGIDVYPRGWADA